MGRNAGFLTAASALAHKYPDDGPHLIYLPERVFDVDQFLLDVKDAYAKYGRCIVAVSEGIKDKYGRPFVAGLTDHIEKDAHGNLQLSGSGSLGDMLATLVKEKLHIERVRSDTLGYIQRNFIGAISDVDAHEAREVGEKAAQFAIWDNVDGSIVLDRTGDYSINYRLVSLEEIAGKTKYMPDNFINIAGNGVTPEFTRYARPLIGSGFPQPHRLRAPMARKLLHEE
jgi:6-phosphofructokinase 1